MYEVTIFPLNSIGYDSYEMASCECTATEYNVVVTYLCDCGSEAKDVDSLLELPCLRSADLLAQYFCVKYKVGEYDIKWKDDVDLSDIAGVKVSHQVAH